jgi:hypothetical protein
MTTLPNLELKFTKQSELKNESTNSNANTINNNIILNPQAAEKLPQSIIKSNSISNLSRIDTPDNVKQFKEALILILISYFKNNVILLNNLVELSEKIITKVDDLKLLISLLLNTSPSNVCVEVEDVELKGCCAKVCKHLPRYRKIKDIIIDKKQSFKVAYNQFYIQIGTEFNISLEFVLL